MGWVVRRGTGGLVDVLRSDKDGDDAEMTGDVDGCVCGCVLKGRSSGDDGVDVRWG